MKTTKSWAALLAAMGLAAGLAFGGTAAAGVITLTPENTFYLDIGGQNSEPELFGPLVTFKDNGEDKTVSGANYTDDTARLELLYKSDFVERENGVDQDPVDSSGAGYEGSYTTTFNPSNEDPTDATITWVVDSPYIICPDCYLAIKDGAEGYYTFNLNDVSSASDLTGAWDGKVSIVMTGFWADSAGAISHVSIWGEEVDGPQDNDDPPEQVPEPMSLALFGAGLLGLGWVMRRRNQV